MASTADKTESRQAPPTAQRYSFFAVLSFILGVLAFSIAVTYEMDTGVVLSLMEMSAVVAAIVSWVIFGEFILGIIAVVMGISVIIQLDIRRRPKRGAGWAAAGVALGSLAAIHYPLMLAAWLSI